MPQPRLAPDEALVVSDAHLGAVPEQDEIAFRAFLREAGEATRDLVIAGDLFEFWFEYRTVVLRRHFATLRILADLADRGVRIRFVGGNHDAWAGSFLRDEVGMELLEGPCVVSIGGRRTYLAHGDGLASGDLGYKVLKRVIRSRPTRALFRRVHPDLSSHLVRLASRTAERGSDGPGPRERHRAEILADHAEDVLRSDPEIRLVVFGHSHVPDLREIGLDRHYLNPGDWVHHRSYAVVGPARVELRFWEAGDP